MARSEELRLDYHALMKVHNPAGSGSAMMKEIGTDEGLITSLAYLRLGIGYEHVGVRYTQMCHQHRPPRTSSYPVERALTSMLL